MTGVAKAKNILSMFMFVWFSTFLLLICDNIGVKWDKELGKFGGFGEGCYLMYSLPIWEKVFLWFISLVSKFNLALASQYLSL